MWVFKKRKARRSPMLCVSRSLLANAIKNPKYVTRSALERMSR